MTDRPHRAGVTFCTPSNIRRALGLVKKVDGAHGASGREQQQGAALLTAAQRPAFIAVAVVELAASMPVDAV